MRPAMAVVERLAERTLVNQPARTYLRCRGRRTEEGRAAARWLKPALSTSLADRRLSGQCTDRNPFMPEIRDRN